MDSLEQELGISISGLYSKSMFGKVLKSDIDLAVFHYRLKKYMLWKVDSPDNVQSIDWYQIDQQDIRQISLSLQITETKVASLIEQCALANGLRELSDTEVIDLVSSQVDKTPQSKADLEKGVISVCIPNKITQKAIESFLSKSGGIPDTSFNRSVLKLRLVDILLGLENVGDRDLFLKKLIKGVKKKYKDQSIDEVIRKVHGKNYKVQIEEIIKSVLCNSSSAGILYLLKMAVMNIA